MIMLQRAKSHSDGPLKVFTMSRMESATENWNVGADAVAVAADAGNGMTVRESRAMQA